TSRGARSGLVEAKKAAHPLYMPVHRFYVWLGRRRRLARIGVWLAGVFVFRASLRGSETGNPFLIGLFVVVALLFVLVWWGAIEPIANLLLRWSENGSSALSPAQRRSSLAFAGCIVSAGGLRPAGVLLRVFGDDAPRFFAAV